MERLYTNQFGLEELEKGNMILAWSGNDPDFEIVDIQLNMRMIKVVSVHGNKIYVAKRRNV